MSDLTDPSLKHRMATKESTTVSFRKDKDGNNTISKVLNPGCKVAPADCTHPEPWGETFPERCMLCGTIMGVAPNRAGDYRFSVQECPHTGDINESDPPECADCGMFLDDE